MTDELFLNGKLRRISLPCLRGSPGPDAPLLKRLLLPQGELAQFCDGAEPVRYIAAVELLPGHIRGNHYHHRKREWLYLFSGDVTLHAADSASLERLSLPLRPGDLAFFSPGLAHALDPRSHSLAVEFSPTPFDPADTHRFQLA